MDFIALTPIIWNRREAPGHGEVDWSVGIKSNISASAGSAKSNIDQCAL